MRHEHRCSRCGNILEYKKDGIYIEYSMIWVDNNSLVHEKIINAPDDKAAKRKFWGHKSHKKKKRCSEIRLLKKTTSIKRTRNKNGKVIKIRKVEEYVQLA